MNIPDDKINHVELDHSDPPAAGHNIVRQVVGPLIDSISEDAETQAIIWSAVLATAAGMMARSAGTENAASCLRALLGAIESLDGPKGARTH